jgi:hypothetical protein
MFSWDGIGRYLTSGEDEGGADFEKETFHAGSGTK